MAVGDKKWSVFPDKTTLVDADILAILDSAEATLSLKNKKITWINLLDSITTLNNLATLTNLPVANGIVQTDVSGNLSSSVTLPDGTLATTQPAFDGSTKLATTKYVDDAVDVENVWDDDGTDVKTNKDPRNVNLQNGAFKDNDVTTAIPLGDSSNTTLDTTNQTLVGSINEINGNVPSAVVDTPTVSIGQTVFTTSQTPISDDAFMLFLNGQLRTLGPSNDYTRSGTTVTWLNPGGVSLIATDEIKFVYNIAAGAVNIPAKIENNYIHAYDTTTQTVAVVGTPQDITFNTNHHIDGWTHTPGTADFTCAVTGTYRIDFTAFCQKTGGAPANAEILLIVNGVEEIGSHTSFELTANNTVVTAANNGMFDITAGQILKFNLSGTTTFVQLYQHAASEPRINFTCTRIR